MPERKERRFLVIVSVKDCSQQHLSQVVPLILRTLGEVAIGPVEQVFRALQADIFGYFLRSRSSAREIRQRLEAPGNARIGAQLSAADMPFLTNDDPILVLEVGEDFDGRGFSRAWTWLQHH
jgi:hypothetical protein